MTFDIDEGERQLVVCALAGLAVDRPGWDQALSILAGKFAGQEMFENFKTMATPLNDAIAKIEFEHASPDRQVTVTVNGLPHAFVGRTISYEQVLKLAFGDAVHATIYSMTFYRGSSRMREGILSPGLAVDAQDGMIFNACITDRA